MLEPTKPSAFAQLSAEEAEYHPIPYAPPLDPQCVEEAAVFFHRRRARIARGVVLLVALLLLGIGAKTVIAGTTLYDIAPESADGSPLDP